MDEFTDFEQTEMLFNPAYQTNLFMIEQALQQVGALEKPKSALPDVYDDELRKLIDSVTLE